MLTVRSVAHRYGGRRVLAAPDLSLVAGEHCALVGPSGSGKTTLLSLIGCMVRPTSGRIRVDGVEATRLSEDRLADLRRRKFGFVFQNFNLLPRTSALENVAMPLSYTAGHLSDRQALQQAREMLRRVGLEDRMDHEPSQLSGGQQQRVAIARAIVNRPQVLLADEPTSSLDDENAQKAIDLLFEAARMAGALLVVATHDGRVRARFDRTVEISRPVA